MLNLYTSLENLAITVENYHKAEIEFKYSGLKRLKFIPISKKACYELLIKLSEERAELSTCKTVKNEINEFERLKKLQMELLDLTTCRIGLAAILVSGVKNENETLFRERAEYYGYYETKLEGLIRDLMEAERQTHVDIEALTKKLKKEKQPDKTTAQRWLDLFNNIDELGRNNSKVTIKSPMLHYISAINKSIQAVEVQKKEIERLKNGK